MRTGGRAAVVGCLGGEGKGEWGLGRADRGDLELDGCLAPEGVLNRLAGDIDPVSSATPVAFSSPPN
jgi:hypothetical protein